MSQVIFIVSMYSNPPIGIAKRGPAMTIRADYLRCEYLVDPIGVDETSPRLSWKPVATDPKSHGVRQSAYRIIVASDPARLSAKRADLWNSGKVESSQSFGIHYSGNGIHAGQTAYWRVQIYDGHGRASKWSLLARWTAGPKWQANWVQHGFAISDYGPSDGTKKYDPLPSTMVRKEFTLAETPKMAYLFASALGVYEAHINGKRVGDHILAPEWTDYRDRVQYQGYDVTRLLHKGRNVIAAILGDGWYAGRVGWFPRAMWGRVPAFCAQLEVDGQTAVVTDQSWLSSAEGHMRNNDMMDGQVQDARVGFSDWDQVEKPGHSWRPVQFSAEPAPRLVSQPNEPIRIHLQRKPIAITEPQKGEYVVDFGQNMVGWARAKLTGKANQTAKVRYAEVLNDDGTIYTLNLRSASQTDSYLFNHSGSVVFEPHFTYHGFRYIEITGIQKPPALNDVTAMVFNSTSPEVGSFSCSNPMLNHLWENILWTQRANLMSSPTDCPQRDERLGWMGDIQAFCQTAIYNMDLDGFLYKWTQDQRDAQSSSGLFPEYAPWPAAKDTAKGSPAWSDAGVFVPWTAYQNYGDRKLLANHYDAAKRYVDFLNSNNPSGLWLNMRGHDFNDWLNGDTLIKKGWPVKGGAIPPEVLATAFMARSTWIVSKMAAVLGHASDAEHYGALAAHCRDAFCRAYVDGDGRIKGDTQAGYALALNFDLLPEGMRAKSAKHMAEAVAKYGDHISTGIQTTHRLMLELTRWGYNDLAYRLILNRTFPSWGYTIDNGATTIWERWDGYVKGRGFQNPGMNSFNHWALGSVGEWMIKVIGGLWPGDDPGWAHPIIHPMPGGKLTHAEVSYDSVRGKWSVTWLLKRGRYELRFTVPANSSATVVVPGHDGLKLEQPGLRFTRFEGSNSLYEALSGTFRVNTKWSPRNAGVPPS